MCLKVSDVPEFKGAYQRINDYFSKIAPLLNASDSKEDKLYKTALKRFKPLEINGINLGFSESKHGAALNYALPTIWWFTVFQAMKQAYKINKMS